jgi:hypothetical protein
LLEAPSSNVQLAVRYTYYGSIGGINYAAGATQLAALLRNYYGV